MPTTGVLAEGYNISFDWPVFFSQLFGFVVIIWLFVKYLLPFVKKTMNKAQDTIRRQLEESEAAAERLTAAKTAYDSAVAEAQAELERMREEARADADRIIAQMREAATAEVERVRRVGRDQILQFRRQMMRDLEADLSAAMLALTEEKVREQVGTPQARSESIERFLDDLEMLANSAPAARQQPQTGAN
ncbi:MAG: synthase subunit b-delta [Glaciihabitans sp.]|nr:synthase subunit b-delta [Glaciihabitans sp.]